MELLTGNIKVVGFDAFVIHKQGIPEAPKELEGLVLSMISNRGTKVWPGPAPKIQMTDVFGLRYVSKISEPGRPMPSVSSSAIRSALEKMEALGFEWVHLEKLLEIDGVAGFAKGQGE